MRFLFLSKLKIYSNSKAFTLVELLVVISIIGVLSSVVFASLNSARAKARDARRMSDIKSIQTALEVYKDAFDEYPRALPSGSFTERYARSTQSTGNGTNNYSWYNLRQNLLSYISLPSDPVNSGSYYYIYDADSGDNYQSYGLSVNFESSSNDSRESGDGGYDNTRYEVGSQPQYCYNTYATAANRTWFSSTADTICVGGN